MPVKAKHGSHWISDKLRHAIYSRDAFICAYCQQMTEAGRGPNGRSIDHIIPRSKGGSHQAENLVTAHIKCNSARKDDELSANTFNYFKALANRPLVLA